MWKLARLASQGFRYFRRDLRSPQPRFILVIEERVMTTATISSSGLIAIPKAVREQLHLEAGTQLSIDVEGEQLVLKRVEPSYPDWRTMQGMLRGGESLTKALEEERAAEVAHDDARAKGR